MRRFAGIRLGMGLPRSVVALVIGVAGLWLSTPQSSVAALPAIVAPSLIETGEIDITLLRGRLFTPADVLNVGPANVLSQVAARRDTPPAEACDIDALRLKLAILQAQLDAAKNALLLKQIEGSIVDATIRVLRRALFGIDLQLDDNSYTLTNDILRPIRTNYADLLDQARAERQEVQRAEEKLEGEIEDISAEMAPIEVQIRRCQAH